MTLREDQKLKTEISSVAGVVKKANSVMDIIPKVGNKTGPLFVLFVSHFYTNLEYSQDRTRQRLLTAVQLGYGKAETEQAAKWSRTT